MNGKYLMQAQSLRPGLGILSTANIQALGNNEMTRVFIQMFAWLSGTALMYE